MLIFGLNMAVEVESQGCMLPQQWVFDGWCHETEGSSICAASDCKATVTFYYPDFNMAWKYYCIKYVEGIWWHCSNKGYWV